MSGEPVYETQLANLELIGRGKVRDIYAIDDAHMLIVTTDRLSAFDVVFDEPVPGKGELLTEVSNFWFGKTADLVTNHLTDLDLRDHVSAADYELRHAANAINTVLRYCAACFLGDFMVSEFTFSYFYPKRHILA